MFNSYYPALTIPRAVAGVNQSSPLMTVLNTGAPSLDHRRKDWVRGGVVLSLAMWFRRDEPQGAQAQGKRIDLRNPCLNRFVDVY